MPFLPRFFLTSEGEVEGQSSDPAASSSDLVPLPKSLDEDGEPDAMTRAIGTLLLY